MDALARTVGTVTGRVDRIAEHVERVSEGVVHKAAAKVETRRGGAYAASIIHWLRDGIVREEASHLVLGDPDALRAVAEGEAE